MGDFKLSTYMTAHAVRGFLRNEELFRRFLSVVRALNITRIYVENYRDGLLLGDDEVDAMVKKLEGEFEL
ncbi:MAG: hypothetical protein RXN91_10600, partial [Caldivirga sp.]